MKRIILFSLRVLLLWLVVEPLPGSLSQAAQSPWEEQTEAAEETSGWKEMAGEELEHTFLEELELNKTEQTLNELLGEEQFSFGTAVKKLMKGELPFQMETIKTLLIKTLFEEVNTYRKTAVYILIMIVASAVFMNFIAVFDRGQIAEISYYMMYLLMITLLMKVFMNMSQVTAAALHAVVEFMKVLLPSCFLTVLLTSGSLTAAGFSQLTLLAITGIQWMFSVVLLPMTQVYVMLLFLNQMMPEDYISKLTELIRTILLWMIKSSVAVLVGLQGIQLMIAPSVDRMKTSLLSKAIAAIPGIGNAYESMSEVAVGSALLLKNSVGTAGLIALLLLTLVPLVKLAFGMLLYKALGAIAQPVTDKRVAECISSVADGAEILLRIVGAAALLFFLSLAMCMVLIRGE